MKSTEPNDKVQQLCDLLHAQALEPAQTEAREIVQAAKANAEKMAQDAKRHADQLIREAQMQINREREVVETSLKQAARQAIVSLRVEIEKKIFGEGLFQVSKEVLSKEDLVGELIRAYIESIRKEGIQTDLSVLIDRHANMPKLAAVLGDDMLKSLRQGTFLPVLSTAGIKLQLHDKHLTVECSETTLTEILAQYLRKDLRERLFNQS